MNQRTLRIADAIRKTNPAAANAYIDGASRREYIDKQVNEVFNPPPVKVDELPKKERRRGKVRHHNNDGFALGDVGRAEFR